MRVGVAGALGRMGRVACAAIAAASDLELVAGFSRANAGEKIAEHVGGVAGDALLFDDLGAFYENKLDVVIDFTVYPISTDVAREALDAGTAPVIGATGWTEEDVISFTDAVDATDLGAMFVPNFAVGAIVMMRLCEIAAPHFGGVEIVEYHHDDKRDAPSGTAKLTARRIAAGSDHRKIPIHSVRLPGLVAHQEVLFGATGQSLTIRHDSYSRESYTDGIVLAARRVRDVMGVRVGLESLVFSSEAVPQA